MLVDSFRMALRFQRGNRRLALTIVALACGVALVCAIDLVNRAVLHAFTEVIDTMAGRAALQVTAGQSGIFPEEISEKVAAVPGVELAVPVVSSTAFTVDESGDLLTVHGVEVTNEKAVRVYESRDAGGLDIGDPLEFLNQANSVVLTRAFAERKHLQVGEQIELDTPTGRRTFVVRGLLEPQGVAKVYGGNLVVMDLYAAEASFTEAGYVNRVDVVVKRDAKLAEVSEAIRAALTAGFTVQTPDQRKADLQAVMQSLQTMLSALGIIALLAAFLIAFNRLSVVFDSRTWLLGVMRGIGLTMPVLYRELLKESVVLGLVGAGVGVAAGIGLGWLILPVVATTTALNSKLVASGADFTVSPVSLAIAVTLGVAAAVLAALVPAWRIAQVAPIQAIQSRGMEQRGPTRKWPRITFFALLAASGVCVVVQGMTREAAWGLVATGLIALAAAVAAPWIQTLFRPALAGVLFRVFGSSTGFGRALLAQYPRRSSLTVAMLGVGLGSVVWLTTVATSFETSLADAMPRVLRGDLAVSSTRRGSGAIDAPIGDSIVAEVAALPGVAAVVGERSLDWQYAGGPIALGSSDPEYFTGNTFGDWTLVGTPLPGWRQAVINGEAALASSNFVRNLHIGVGDSILLETPSGPLALVIAGVIDDFLSPRGSLEVSRDVVRRYWRDSQVTHVLVRASDPVRVDELRHAVLRALRGHYEVKALTIGELVSFLVGQVHRAFAPVQVLAAVVLLVVLVGLADTLAANVVDRTREFGTARAVGLQSATLNRFVVVESLLLATMGLVLAVSMGLILGTLWVDATFVYLLGWVLQLHFPLASILGIVALTLAVALAAALPVSRRAARVEPAAALRYE